MLSVRNEDRFAHVPLLEMNYPHFVLIEQEDMEGSTQYYVVHTQDPKLAVRFATETVNGRLQPGTILRISVPNSWAGEYSKYAKLVSQAEAFFRASLMSETDRVANRLRR